METRPLTREEVVVHGLLEEGVAERVALDTGRRVGYQDLPADALAQRLVQRPLVHRHGRRDQRGFDTGPAADATRKNSWVARRGSRPRQEHVAEGRGQFGPAVVAGGRQQLLGEEGVAAGARMDHSTSVASRSLPAIAAGR